MTSTEKDIEYKTCNSYSTLNTFTEKTKNVWFVNHGLGYLSRSFIKYFSILNADENYIIAPQAPSKYYLGNEFKNVGACWLTKDNTEQDIENILNYLDAVYLAEAIPKNVNFITLGYSQGVSVTARWVARRKIECEQMILYAGGIPNELNPEDFTFFDKKNTKVHCVYGDIDPYINKQRLGFEIQRIEELFGHHAQIQHFKGGHEFKNTFLSRWISYLDLKK
ncbi:esterase [Ascidiimonas sp. W6]|uniref:alpha/beta hydrolase n=1 Tax=Ascidiimonas meishanensis TaxID=3128903 RepID=UPI0030EE66D1